MKSRPQRALRAGILVAALALPADAQETATEAAPTHLEPSWIDWTFEVAFEDLPEDVHIGGVFALDLYDYDDRNSRHSGFELDRATLRAQGRPTEHWSWRLAPDLVGIDTRYGLEEAWVAYQPDSTWRATLGLQPIPLGTEFATPEEELSFVGWSFGPYLDARTDAGLSVEGERAEGLFSWQASATAGVGFDPQGNDRDEPQLAARAVTYPFRSSAGEVWPGLPNAGLFVGAALAWTPDWDDELDVLHPFRTKLFDTDDLDADGSRWIHVSSGWDAGSVRLLHEVQRGSLLDVETPSGDRKDLDDQITAWSASLAWMVTGEPYDSRPFRQGRRTDAFPAHPLGVADDWGALELAVRYANADIDRDLFNLELTDYSRSSQEFRTFSFAVNWYATNDFRLTLQVVRTIADDDIRTLDDGGRDTSLVLRTQWWF